MADPTDVFISYKLEERSLAEDVMRALQQAKFTAVTNLSIVKSQEFGDAIDKMIRTARLTLVLWTKASAASDWVGKEARLARDLEKAGKPNRYLGVMVEDVGLDLPVDLRGLQMVDLSAKGLTAESIRLIVAEVVKILGPAKTVSPEMAVTSSMAVMDEFQLYGSARSLDTATAYEEFLSAYPNGKFAADALSDLRKCKAWYFHPFRRGIISHTVSLSVGILGLVGIIWGANQNAGGAGVAKATYDRVLSELKQTQSDVAEANIARTAAEAAADGMRSNLGEAEALAQSRTIEVGQLTTELEKKTQDLAAARAMAVKATEAEAKTTRLSREVARLQAELTSRTGEADKARQELAVSASELETALSRIKNLEAQAAEFQPARIKQPDCDLEGKPGYIVLGSCYATDSTILRLRDTALDDLTPILGFSKLTSLDIGYTKVEDLAAIGALQELGALWVDGTSIEDLSPIGHLAKLHYLITPEGHLFSGHEVISAAIKEWPKP
jgi:hypothetical protein